MEANAKLTDLPENDDEDMEDAEGDSLLNDKLDSAAESIADSVGHQDFSTFNESAENFSAEPKSEEENS